MEKTRTFHRKKTVLLFFLCFFALCFLGGRLAKLMVAESEYYAALAQDLHERSGRSRRSGGGFWTPTEWYWRITGPCVRFL